MECIVKFDKLDKLSHHSKRKRSIYKTLCDVYRLDKGDFEVEGQAKGIILRSLFSLSWLHFHFWIVMKKKLKVYNEGHNFKAFKLIMKLHKPTSMKNYR